MALNLAHLLTLFLLLLVLNPFPLVASRSIKHSEFPFFKTLQNLEGVHEGQTAEGLSKLKNYLAKFGYLGSHNNHHHHDLNTLTDNFDENLESAIEDYQKFHGLDITGRLDAATIQKLSLPRCGVADINKHNRNRNGLVMVSNFTYFDGSPKWAVDRRDLSYIYRSSVKVVNIDDVRPAIASAFLSWARITDFTFTEVSKAEDADIVIGFHSRDHGDGYPFDGPGRVLAHAFRPQDGRMHYDGDESWSSNPSSNQIDLESVAVHEIGHLLGLGHSSNPDSIMFPAYSGKRRNLGEDDIDGIRKLYQYI